MSSIKIISRSQRRDSRETLQVCKMTVKAAPHKTGQASRAIGTMGHMQFSCILGRSTISALKREGDGATPLAEMTVVSGFYRSDRWPMAYRAPWMIPLAENMGWCDAPEHPNYNRAVKLPFAASHEKLMRDDRLYDCVLILDWNISRRARNKGSAIFMHLTSPNKKPTEGCIAVEPEIMRHLVKRLKPYDKIMVIY